MKQKNNAALELFRKIMRHCKQERKAKTSLSNKQLASELKITDNYVSALESGRAVPSIQVFLDYLLACGFDVDALTRIEISPTSEKLKPLSQARTALIRKIYTFDEEQIGYLAEQAKLAEVFSLKIKPEKASKKKSGAKN